MLSSRHTLSDHDGSRENNFTTIRIILAWLVLYGHSYTIQNIPGIRDPLEQLFQGSVWIGGLAVDGFFAISGFLVTASLVKRGMIDYTISRVLRIFPALALCVFASVFILGPALTTLSLADYFSDSRTWSYLRNALAVMKVQWILPGVFEQNSRPATNGSLWTLTVEVRCYLLLLLTTFVGFRYNKLLATVLVAIVFFVGLTSFTNIPLIGFNRRWARPALYFIAGVFLYLHRDKVILDYRIAVFAAIVAYFSFGEEWFDYAFPPTLIYLLFYLAYATPALNTDAKVGDISYGIYIYAWPMQQLVAQFFPGQMPYFNTMASSVLVITLAWLSWHFVEKPVLGYKRLLLDHSGSRQWLQKYKLKFIGKVD